MAKFFGVPIIISMFLGMVFPFLALSLMPLAFVFLFLLMIWAGLTVTWTILWKIPRQPLKILIGLLFLFGIFPLLQWLIARFLVRDIQLLYGLVFASLTPAAIVAPYFTRLIQGDEELSFLLMVTSMLLCPLITPLMLELLVGDIVPFQTWPLFKNMLLLVTVPLGISFLISVYLPKVRQKVTPYLSILNMGSLSILVFILWGNAIGRLNLSYTSPLDIMVIVSLVFFQDFGILWISRLLFARYFALYTANALTVTLSMKNVAIAAGLLLFYDPKASFPPAVAFVAHAFLFNFIPIFKKLFTKGQVKDHV